MSRKKNKENKQKTNQANQEQSKDSKDLESLTNLDNKLEEMKLKNEISDTAMNKLEINETDNDGSIKLIKETYYKAQKIEKILEKQKNTNQELKDNLSKEKDSLEKERNENIALKTELKQRLDKYNTELTEINLLRVEGGWSSVIDKKLLDSYTDQMKLQEEILADKIKKLSEKHSEYLSVLSDLGIKKIDLENEFQLKIKNAQEKLEIKYQNNINAKEIDLEELSNDIENKKRKLAQDQKEFKYEIEDFDEEKEYLIEKARKKVEIELEDLNNEKKNLKQKNQALKVDLKDAQNNLKHLGDSNAKDVINDLRDKETQIFKLTEKLETSPNILKVDELKRLRNEKNDWQAKFSELGAQVNEYKSRYENQKLQIGEKERLEFQKEELELRIKLQQTALGELKEEVKDLTKESDTKVTFISCSEMDEKYNKATKFNKNSISEDWLNNMQQAIAQVTDNELYYDKNTIRSFIAGLAMSKFSILQGISGTGKTSLPKAFAEAIGGNFGVVEVQSGWKDRQDLIGYYNTFEKKYYEGKFLKWLYMAGTPKYNDKPFFIILDEMNLSHPEHYFADLLSIMEETNPEKQVLNISDKVSDIPQLMSQLEEGGLGLKIPKNVWFIGTANHDETTLQFAPKTYDRANILEMPINIDRFKIEDIDTDKVKISNDNFLAFTRDQKWNEQKKVEQYLTSDFKNICAKLGIGWGNRLQKQINLFIPVFIALDGEIADALDHIIASKVLRSIKGRYDLQKNTLTEIKTELETNFKTKFKGDAKKSLQIINNELNRMS